MRIGKVQEVESSTNPALTLCLYTVELYIIIVSVLNGTIGAPEKRLFIFYAVLCGSVLVSAMVGWVGGLTAFVLSAVLIGVFFVYLSSVYASISHNMITGTSSGAFYSILSGIYAIAVASMLAGFFAGRFADAPVIQQEHINGLFACIFLLGLTMLVGFILQKSIRHEIQKKGGIEPIPQVEE